MANIVDRHRPPPPQVMHGSGFNLTFEQADELYRYRLRRRAQVVTSGGVVKTRIVIVTYEATSAGMVYRHDEDGRTHVIEPGDDMGEFRWVQAALFYRRLMKHAPAMQPRYAPRPPDLVSLLEERNGRWVEITDNAGEQPCRRPSRSRSERS